MVRTYTIDSDVFKSKVLQGATISQRRAGMSHTFMDEMEVVIELELTSDYSAINDVKEISLPGIELLHPEDFVNLGKRVLIITFAQRRPMRRLMLRTHQSHIPRSM